VRNILIGRVPGTTRCGIHPTSALGMLRPKILLCHTINLFLALLSKSKEMEKMRRKSIMEVMLTKNAIIESMPGTQGNTT